MKKRLVALIAVIAAMLVGLPMASPAQAVTTSKQSISWIVSAHPDDVMSGYSLVVGSSANYPVFVTLTRGEGTGYCKNDFATNINVQYYPGGFDRADHLSPEAGCKGARMASLNNWLDDQSDHDAYLNDYVRGEDPSHGYNMTKHVDLVPMGGYDDGAPTIDGQDTCNPGWAPCVDPDGNHIYANIPQNPNERSSTPHNLNDEAATDNPDYTVNAQTAIWYVGATSARVEFDLGDGNVTDDEILWALAYARSKIGTYLPDLPEYAVVGATYSNVQSAYSACVENSERDHRAVHEAIYANRIIPQDGLVHPQYAATCGYGTSVSTSHATAGTDPEVNRINDVGYSYYHLNMDPGGLFQNRFGWLSNGDWPSGAYATDNYWPQYQSFWRSF